eukprot:CAMPEP_0119545958 /NCGR_PEP_ID=MMETSP1352-20130426/559_1 /TAXON_ID=265584 /ORGANISM="Stauroneis constricta, Strain CCMP1120" /LENGTH=299 /DNA_ID=CAMNT_0007590589 /DNA_START=196 /DNA_END=1095 /DNA_ORIENTATION=-
MPETTPTTEATTSSRVSTSVDESTGIVTVALNRPEKLNALDLPMFESIAQTAKDLRSDRSIRAVILKGNGRAFSSGLDVKSLMKKPQNLSATLDKLLDRPSGYGVEGNEIGNLAQDVSYLWRELPVPVICAVHGACFGGGLQIALGADMRYATPDSQMSIMEGKWGLIPDMAITVALREIMSIDHAKELTYTGRIVSGDEALRLGLITRVCEDPVEEAMNVAKAIAQKSPDAVASSKRMYQATWRNQTDKECLELESKLQKKLLVSWNQMAASGRSFGWNVPYTNRKNNDDFNDNEKKK